MCLLKMVQRVSDYVAQLQRGGYSNQVIRSQLVRAGYSSEQIAAAFAGVSRHSFKSYVLFGVLFGVIVLSVVLFFVLFNFGVDVSVDVSAPAVVVFKPGEFVSFEKVIFSSSKTKVSVSYVVLSDSGVRVSEKSEILLISGVSKTKSRVPVPSNPGKYVLQVSVSSDGIVGKSDSFSFIVAGAGVVRVDNDSSGISVESPKIVDSGVVDGGCAQPCVSSDPCLRGVCDGGVCKFDVLSSCCGNGVCESGENDVSCSSDCAGQKSPKESVFALAQSQVIKDVDGALLLCKSLIDEFSVDDCVGLISQRSKNSGLCGSIVGVESRDACFMSFALDGDFSVCDKISDRYMLNSCNYLVKASAVNKQVVV